MEINVVVDKGQRGKISKKWLDGLTRAIVNAAGLDQKSEVSLLLTGQEEIRKLNKQWMGEDRPTDVLSFPMRDYSPHPPTDFIGPPDGAIHLGEVIISYPQAVLQAREHRHTVRKEITTLLVHGVMHLVGHDHDVPSRTHKMRSREQAILKFVQENYL